MSEHRTGAERIADERRRQIEAEGWTPEHDAEHEAGALARAAACYAQPPEWRGDRRPCPVGWPWDPRWWKPVPTDRVRELTKAGALVAAEIDRLLALDRSRFRPRAREPGVSAEHWAGVRIPPDKGDANYRQCRCGSPLNLDKSRRTERCCCCREDHEPVDTAHNAPETPHAPATAPNTTPRGSADAADGSEALREALWAKLDAALDDARDTSIYRWPQQQDVDRILDALLPLVLAYGREQAARALRDAAAGVTKMDADGGYPLRTRTGIARWLNRRADELGRQA